MYRKMTFEVDVPVNRTAADVAQVLLFAGFPNAVQVEPNPMPSVNGRTLKFGDKLLPPDHWGQHSVKYVEVRGLVADALLYHWTERGIGREGCCPLSMVKHFPGFYEEPK